LGVIDDVEPGGLDPDRWVPAPGQGALAVEARSDRADLADLFSRIDDPAAHAEVACERAFAERLEGGCSIPLGCSARAIEDGLVVTGFLGHPDGHDSLRDRISGATREAEELGRELAVAILDAGGADLLEEIRSLEPADIDSP
jgi:hydroxymethylbilane synthase